MIKELDKYRDYFEISVGRVNEENYHIVDFSVGEDSVATYRMTTKEQIELMKWHTLSGRTGKMKFIHPERILGKKVRINCCEVDERSEN